MPASTDLASKTLQATADFAIEAHLEALCNEHIYLIFRTFHYYCSLFHKQHKDMFNFKLYHKPALPAFPVLAAYERKDHYFCRIASWQWLDNTHIVVKDPQAPRLITMDPWPQLIFLDAMGKLTVAGYVDYMAHRYKQNTPERLDATIIEELEKLVHSGLLILSETEIIIQADHDQPRKRS